MFNYNFLIFNDSGIDQSPSILKVELLKHSCLSIKKILSGSDISKLLLIFSIVKKSFVSNRNLIFCCIKIISADASEDIIKKKSLESPQVIKWINNKEIRKIIIVKGKIINIVV